MKNLIYIILTLSLASCLDSEFQSVTEPISDGVFNYQSTSIYYDDRGAQSHQSFNTGTFDRYIEDTQSRLVIYPRIGWSYELVIDNIFDHTLSDGSTVTSFRIQRSTQLISSAYGSDDGHFRVDGTAGIGLQDSDGTFIGDYDGLIYDDGEITFEFESININTGEYVTTKIEGFPEN